MKLRYKAQIMFIALLHLCAGSFAQGLIIPSSCYVIVNSGNVVVYRNLVNSGKFTHNGGYVLFNRTGAQSISGSSATSFDNLIIGSGSVTTISTAGKTVKSILQCNDTLNANGNLTLLSTATRTAMVDGNGTGQVLGNVTMQRYLDTSFGYKIISSPFQAATIGQLSGYVDLSAAFSHFFLYDENVSYTGWTSDTAAGDTIKPMHGYSGNFGSVFGDTTFSLNRVVSNGAMTYTMYNHNQTYTLGFNLAGNPYPSPINWTASTGWTKTNIDNAIYYFNHGDTNQYYGSYSSYISGVSSDGIASNIIPAMQGFFVHVSNGSYPVTGTLACNNSVRITDFNPHYHKPGQRPLLRIDAGFEGGRRSDPAVIYFDASATVNFDKDMEALKLMNTDAGIPSLFSVSRDDNNMSIQALPEEMDSSNEMIPLGLETEHDGSITFNTRNIDDLPAGMHVYFYDSETGVVQDLQYEPKYSRYVNKGKHPNRFFLMFSYKDKNTIAAFNSRLNAYTNNDNLYVELPYGSGVLAVTNMLGQVVLKQELSGSGLHVLHCPFATGIYIATLYSNRGKQSNKVFIGKK